MTTLTFEDDDALAAEYALRLLEGDELSKVQRRLMDDRAFAKLVVDWEIRLSAIADELSPVPPKASTKSALERRLFGTNAPKPFWQNLWLWQGIAALSILALVMVNLTDIGPKKGPVGPLYTAEIVSDAGDFRVVAVVDKSRNEVIMTRTAGAASEGRILQVWAHGPDAPAISVGLWPEGESVRLPMPPVIAAVTDVLTLGVSEEPPGGSTTGSPSGRVFGTVDIAGI